MRKIFYFIIVSILFIGCENSVENKINSYDYSIEQQRNCFCPQAGVWIRLFVKSDTIAKAIYISDNSPLTYEQKRPYRTIKGLFEEIAQKDTSTFYVKVEMDSADNYPSYVYFNPKPKIHGDTVTVINDAQSSYVTKNYTKLN